jgi:hypothetical protein
VAPASDAIEPRTWPRLDIRAGCFRRGASPGCQDGGHSQRAPGAVGASADASFGAVFGDTYIKIGGLTYVIAGQGKQVVRQLHSKL